jgi:hypothetical protein
MAAPSVHAPSARAADAGTAVNGDLPLGTLLGCWLGFTWVAMVIAEGFQVKSTLGQERYFTHVAPPFALLTALGIGHWRRWLAERPKGRLWPAWLAPALVLTFMLPCTIGWLAQNGDGPALLARRMVAREKDASPGLVAPNAAPPPIVGSTFPLEYEFRHASPARALINLNLSTDQARAVLASLADRFSVAWLFVYNNKPDPLDPLLANPPAPWIRVGPMIRSIDARAVLLRRAAR